MGVMTGGVSVCTATADQLKVKKNSNENNSESNIVNLDSVIVCTNINILDENQAVSMSTLHSV